MPRSSAKSMRKLRARLLDESIYARDAWHSLEMIAHVAGLPLSAGSTLDPATFPSWAGVHARDLEQNVRALKA